MLNCMGLPRLGCGPWFSPSAAAILAAALFLPSASAQGAGQGRVPSVDEAALAALPVQQLAERLVNHLQGSLRLIDEPALRVPLGQVAPLVAQAARQHPEARLVGSQLLRTEQARKEAYAAFLPQVSANVDSGTRQYDAQAYPWSSLPAREQKSLGFGLTVRQLLYDFGQTSNRVGAQEAAR
jgi:outer membrane protein TolC